jgi:hypothetical protein
MKRISSALLGYRIVAIERRRIGQIDDDRVLGGILLGETTKKGRAHADTSRDELGRVTWQWWKRLVGRLE